MIVKVVIVKGDLTSDITLQREGPSRKRKGHPENDNDSGTPDVVVLDNPIGDVANVYLQAMQGAGLPVKNIAVELEDDTILWTKP